MTLTSLTNSKQFPTSPKLMNNLSLNQNEDEVTTAINKIRVKIVFKGNILITYIDRTISFENIIKKVRDFLRVFPFTIKWLDNEGDPCTISSQIELDTAIRLHEQNNEVELAIHVFPGKPKIQGMLCPGEDQSVYRRGAQRWTKSYRVNGHIFEAKRFNKKAFCTYCQDRIWGLGRQGFKCFQCKLMIHKKCHQLIHVKCDIRAVTKLIKYNEETLPRPGSSGAQTAVSSTQPGSGSADATHSPLRPPRPGNKTKEEIPKPENETTTITDAHLIETPKSSYDAGITLEDFDLIKVLGRGNFGKVFMAELRKTRRLYALKVIKKEFVIDENDSEWVQTEKNVFEAASNHPFLVGLHSCFQTQSRLIFVIEYISGGDLFYLMLKQNGKGLPERQARFYCAEIALALNFLHVIGIVYRDLKLDNVLLDHEGHIKLTDYGMCKEGHNTGEKATTLCGTPTYMAPEILQINKKIIENEDIEDEIEGYSYAVDWWALGILLFEMLAGKNPFHQIINNPDIPDEEGEKYLFQKIIEDTPIRMPRFLRNNATSILKGFLNKNPVERLGSPPESGFSDIMSHRFFKDINWEMLEQKQVNPPYKPILESDRDCNNFLPEYTDEPVMFTPPDDQSAIEAIDQTEFEGFEYVNPLLMSAAEIVD